MKVLVLGGTRFFGRELVLLLQKDGHEVTVLTRGNLETPEGARHIAGDRNDPQFVKRVAAERFDAIVDNIAYNAGHVNAAVEAFAGNTGHYVMTSSTVVYMLDLRPPYFEEGPPPAPGKPKSDGDKWWPYTAGKIEAERALFEQTRLPFTIVRPPVVIGPNDPTLRLQFYVQRLMDGGPMLLLDGGKHSFHLADSQDLAAGFVRVLGARDVALGQAYNICQRDVCTLEEVVLTSARALGREARLVSVPSAALEGVFEYAEALGPFDQPMICPPQKAMTELGFQPRPVLESVANAARWHAENTKKDSEGYVKRKAEIQMAERCEAAGRSLRP